MKLKQNSFKTVLKEFLAVLFSFHFAVLTTRITDVSVGVDECRREI